MDAHETIAPDARFLTHPLYGPQLIPDAPICLAPFDSPWTVEKKLAQFYQKQIDREPRRLVAAVAVTACLFLASFTCWLGKLQGQPVPCEVAARMMLGPEPALAIVTDVTDPVTARVNREVIEQALRNGGQATLPAGLVAVDRAVRLTSGCTCQGAGPKTILKNTVGGGPFPDGGAICIHPYYNDAGLGYADPFTRGKKTQITFSDAATANKYNVGGWLYTFCWDGYLQGNPQTLVHRISAKSGNTITLNVEPKPGATHAVYVTAGVRVSGALEGSNRLKVAAGDTSAFGAGKQILITAGPSVGNECVGELRRIMAVSSDALTLDRPLRSSYPYPLSLAVILNPVESVTVRDMTVVPFNDQVPPVFFQWADGLTMQRVTAEGQIDLVLCFNARLYDCVTNSSLKLNATRDSTITGGSCRNVFIEEMCSDVEFANVLVRGAATAGINAVAGSPSERITLRDCIVEQAADMPIHLIGRECVVENCTVRNSANPVSYVNNYIGGDGTRVTNFRSDLTTVFKSGRGLSIAHVPSPVVLGWVGPNDQPTGVTVGCPNVDTTLLNPVALAQWAIVAAVE